MMLLESIQLAKQASDRHRREMENDSPLSPKRPHLLVQDQDFISSLDTRFLGPKNLYFKKSKNPFLDQQSFMSELFGKTGAVSGQKLPNTRI